MRVLRSPKRYYIYSDVLFDTRASQGSDLKQLA